MSLQKEIIVWRFLDGKTGHEKQSLALVKFIKNEIKTKLFNIDINNVGSLLFKYKKLIELPKPDLIIGIGHKVHISVLIAKIIFGGKSIIIMKPSMPINWFDLCIIPEHDKYKGKGLIYRTKGALCDGENKRIKDSKKSLILIGGTSKNFIWDSNYLINQIEDLINNNSSIKFLLSTSRRTPQDFIMKLRNIRKKNLIIVPLKDQEENWLENNFNNTKTSWISEDSISMIYESLTAGQQVGILKQKKSKNNRIKNSLNMLRKEGYIFYDEDGNYKINRKVKIFPNEAKKCATWLINLFFGTKF
tara:strand:- start:1389 stop:2297 length:909 start_codon:yes stop_codon:yes gene_type:complete